MINRIAIITLDGGAGKTAIAFSLAKDLDYYLISNDDSVIERAYPDGAKIMKDPKVIDEVVYDFGGFVDSNVLSVIEACDLVIVPCINDLNSKMKAIKTIQQIQEHNKNIIVVGTRLEGDKDLSEIQETIKSSLGDLPMFPLRKTKLFKNALEFGMSPLELEEDSKQVAYTQRNILVEYKALLNYIRGL